MDFKELKALNFSGYKKSLNEFNNKYNTNIEDIDIKKLNLIDKKIGNEGLEFLSKIKFKELKLLIKYQM